MTQTNTERRNQMTARDRAQTHLENARECFEHSANKSRSRVDLYAACILSLIEEAVEDEDECLLRLMTVTSCRLSETASRIQCELADVSLN